jgi:tetratricopeptide (TPR) repeat protein
VNQKLIQLIFLSIFTLIILTSTGCKTKEDNPFAKGPYVQNLRQTEMTIVWESDSASLGKVFYGKNNNLNMSAETNEFGSVKKVTLKDLEPESTYIYKVEVNGIKSKKRNFRTAVKDGSPFTFAAYGDNKNGPFNHKKIADLILSYKPLFVSNNGDLVERGYIFKQWEKLFFTPAKEMIASIPLIPAIGNHEENAEYYYKYFCLPKNNAWHSFNLNGAHFVVINTEEEFMEEDGEQIIWLKNDLKNNNSKWTFAFQHIPPLTSGGNYYSRSRIDVKNILHPIYVQYKVDMVITGHDHHYERSKPVVSNNGEHGVTYIVGGNGGTSMRYIGKPKEFSLKSTRTFGFALIEIEGTKMNFKEISIDNKILDEFTLDKSDPNSVAEYMKNKISFDDIHDPVQASKLYSKGKKAFSDGGYQLALDYLLKAYEIDNNCEEATAMIGEVYFKMKNFENARKYADITIKIAPLHPDSYEVIASIYKKKKEYDKSIEWSKKQLSIQPDNPNALSDIAEIYEELGKYDLAIQIYSEAIDILPNDWELHFKLAELYEKIGKVEEALSEYKFAVEWFYDENEHDNHLVAIKKVRELSN